MANDQMTKLGGTDTQTQKFLFCLPRKHKVGHHELCSSDMDLVALVWWEWLGFLSEVKLKVGDTEFEYVELGRMVMWEK